jgi:WD40 repeat protein
MQTVNPGDGTPPVGFFGPATLAPPFPAQDAAGRACSPAKQSAFPRRFPRENGTNGLLSETSSQAGAKRSRKSTETANGIDRPNEPDPAERSLNGVAAVHGNGYAPMLLIDQTSATEGAPMPKSPPNDEAADEEIDADVDMGMSPSETTTPICPPTDGPSAGVQTWNDSAARETRSPSRPQADPLYETLPVADDQHVMRTSFNPKNPSILVANGKQMCRLWNRSKHPSGRSSPHQYEDIVHPGSEVEVTAAAWDSRGYRLAVATFDRSEWGQVNIYDEAGFLTDTLPGAQNLISALRWQPNESQLLGISTNGFDTEIIVWDLSSEESLAPMRVKIPATDAIWTGLNQFHACGGRLVYTCRADRDIQITNEQSIPSDQADAEEWTYIRFAPAESFSVTAVASADNATLWIPEHDILYKHAHKAGITGMEFKPRDPVDPTLKDLIMLATSSMDASVKIWIIQVPEKHIFQSWSLELGIERPAMSLSWSPDTVHIAAGSGDKLFVWKLERGHDPQLRYVSNFAHAKGNALAMAQDPLSWSADSNCIAYGGGRMVCVLPYESKPSD